jgi:hypothetical protein
MSDTATVEVVLRLSPAEATTLYDFIGNHAHVYHGHATRLRICTLRRRLRTALADLGMFAL